MVFSMCMFIKICRGKRPESRKQFAGFASQEANSGGFVARLSLLPIVTALLGNTFKDSYSVYQVLVFPLLFGTREADLNSPNYVLKSHCQSY